MKRTVSFGLFLATGILSLGANSGSDIAMVCTASSAPTLQKQFDLSGSPEPKNRTIAVLAGDIGQQQAVRVRWDAQPNWSSGHDLLVGQEKWMTAPFQVCENSADGLAVSPPDCGPLAGQPQRWFWAASLTCDPTAAHFADLTTLTNYCTASGESCLSDAGCAQGTCGVDGVIHLIDQGISPTKNLIQQAIYSVQVIEIACPIGVEDNFSLPLVVTQPLWGDIGGGSGCPLPPPNGAADIVPDLTGVMSKFSNLLCAPKKTRTDIAGEVLNFKVDIYDVLHVLNAFKSGSRNYPFAAGPTCPAVRR